MNLFETLQHRRGRVLFVSQSNSCRDQMAEAFARALGEDSMLAFSAGTSPAGAISSAARAAMAEKGFPLLADQKPRPLADLDLRAFDVIVNMSESDLPPNSALVLQPSMPSPLANDLDSHRLVRDRIETFVRFLIEHFRRAKQGHREARGSTAANGPARPASQTKPSQPPARVPLPGVSRQPVF
jgi:arsenate reductase (thioredoxin)